MTPTERKVVSDALSGLDSVIVDDYVYPHVRLDVKAFGTAIDLYDYRAHGKMVIGKRMLADLLGRPQDYLLSGECYDEEYADEDPISELCRFVDPSDTEKHELEPIKKGLTRGRLHTNVLPCSLSRTIKDMLYYLPSLPSFDTSTFTCYATQTRATLVSLCK